MWMGRILAAAVLAALTLTTLAGPARADVYDDNPAAASRGAGDMYLFARGPDGDVLERHLSGGSWTAWSSLGGQATSGPAAASQGDTIRLFVRGPDGAIYERVLSGGAWSSWTSLGGYATSAPAAAWRRGPENLFDLAVKGIDNQIYLQTFVPGRGWSGWSGLGGTHTSAPSLTSQADGIVNVHSRGGAADLVQRSWTGTGWFADWQGLAGTLTSAPSALARDRDVVDVFARGLGDSTYQRHWDSANGWGGWTLLDQTPIDSAPIAASDTPGRVILFARHGGHVLSKRWDAASGWTGWADFGAVAVPVAPPPAAPPADGELRLETGLRCTPPGGRVRVDVEIRKPRGKAKARVARVVFYTKGKGRAIRVDRKAPFVVRLKINRPAGSTGRVYARVHYRRSAKGKLHSKTVSRRYVVCR
jgi:hypothetical protein